MYKMKMRIVVDVEITGKDANQAFELLDNTKYNLQRATLLPSCVIKSVRTDAMLSEETFEAPVNQTLVNQNR
jgi:hypothetical protein